MNRRASSVVLAVVALVATIIVSAAVPASAASGYYTIAKSNGTFLGAGNNLWRSGVDDAVKRVTFPFVVKIFNTRRTDVWVSSNGNLQFGPNPSSVYTNGCLPDGRLSGPAIAVYYDDILIRDNASSGDGVFTKTYGSSPNRKFVIVWRGVEFSDPNQPVRVEIIFYEGRTYFDAIYAAGQAELATIGIQNYYLTISSQFTCNSGSPALSTNDQLRFAWRL